MANLATTLPDVTISLDETGDFPLLTIITGRKLDRREVAECHRLAGDHGAAIKFISR